MIVEASGGENRCRVGPSIRSHHLLYVIYDDGIFPTSLAVSEIYELCFGDCSNELK